MFVWIMGHLSSREIRCQVFKVRICVALRDLVPFVQFKKREKHPWTNGTKLRNASHITFNIFDILLNFCQRFHPKLETTKVCFFLHGRFLCLTAFQTSGLSYVMPIGSVVRRCSSRKVFIKISQISHKNMCWSLFLNKVARLRACSFIKKRFQYRCFPVKFAKFLITRFFTEHFQWLLLGNFHYVL